MNEPRRTSKREFLKTAGVTTASAVAATTIGAPYIAKAQSPIKWRLQTYAGVALAEHVIKPSIDAFNVAANGEMVIELYTADQLVPQGELFRAVQTGTIDAAQSDDDLMAAPVDVAVFGAYFPFASRYSLDVPVLWNWYGLKEIWEEAYAEVGERHLAQRGLWDPCNFATTKPLRSLADLNGAQGVHLPDGRPVHATLRRRPGDPALRGCRGRGPNRRAGWRLLVRYHRGLHGRLGGCDEVLSDQSNLRCLGGLVLRQHREMGRAARAPEDVVQVVDGQLALLPAALVLVG